MPFSYPAENFSADLKPSTNSPIGPAMAHTFDQLSHQIGRLLEEVERGLRDIVDHAADGSGAPLADEQRAYLTGARSAAAAALEALEPLRASAPAGPLPAEEVLAVDEVWLRVDGDRELLTT